MKRALARMRERGLFETSRVTPYQTALALQRRGLVEVRRNGISGAVCVLTDKGRGVAQKLPT